MAVSSPCLRTSTLDCPLANNSLVVVLETLERLCHESGENGWLRKSSLETRVCWVQENKHSSRMLQMSWQQETVFTVYQGMHVNTKDSFPVWVASRKLFPGRNIHRFSLLCRP